MPDTGKLTKAQEAIALIEAKVRRTICNTYSSGGKQTVEGRIESADFEVLLSLAQIGAAQSQDDRPKQIAQELKTALGHIEHMAAFINKNTTGYSFESLEEDISGMRSVLDLMPSDMETIRG